MKDVTIKTQRATKTIPLKGRINQMLLRRRKAELIKMADSYLKPHSLLYPHDTTMVHLSPPMTPISSMSMEITKTLPIYTNMMYYPIYTTYPYNYHHFNNWDTNITGPVATPVLYEFPQMYSPQVHPHKNVTTQNVYAEPVFTLKQPLLQSNRVVPSPCFGYEQPILEEVFNTIQEETIVHDITNTSTSSGISNTSSNTPNTSFDTLNTSLNTYNTILNTTNTIANLASTLAVTRPNFVGPVSSRDTVQPLEYYLQLDKKLFPPPRFLKIDPNPVIDAFCTLADVQYLMTWVADLEFGAPREPGTKHIAQYDMEISSVVSRTTGMIHPAYESCSQEFQHIISMYYNFVVGAWYKGYLNLKRNESRSSFEAWINRPIETFGMCWP